MRALQAYLIAGWLLLFALTVRAVMALGLAGGEVFLSDFAQPWRAQFNTDFTLYALPITAWVFWREASWLTGLLCALGTLAGGVFTLRYLLVASVRARGDLRCLLLGRHWRA
jgi:hypothetical protein